VSASVANRIPILEVGGSHVTAAWIDARAWSVDQAVRREMDGHLDSDALIREFVSAAEELQAPTGADWGVAMPGPFDYLNGVAHYTGVGKFDNLNGVDVRAELTRLLPGRPGSVSFINDASAFLVGEWLAGAARGADRSAGLTLGTGVGSAFLADGVVIDDGSDVPPEAEVHLLGYQDLPLEDWVSRRAIRRRYAEDSGRTDDPDVREIADLARDGDVVASEIFRAAFTILGEVVGPWMHRFGAEVIVLGGSISRSWDLIETPLHTGLSVTADVPIRLAEDAERSALLGAAYPALRSSAD
jgi:glucokinase